MLIPGPLVEWECILKILRGEGLLVLEFPQFPSYAFLIRGDAPPWPILRSGRLAGPKLGAGSRSPAWTSIGSANWSGSTAQKLRLRLGPCLTDRAGRHRCSAPAAPRPFASPARVG